MSVAWVTLTALLALLDDRPAPGNPSLFVLPGAADIRQDVTEQSQTVEYYIRESYPARKTIALIHETLAGAAWKALAGKTVSSGTLSSSERGWLELPSDSSLRLARLWSSTWHDAVGNEVTYSLSYVWPEGDHALQPIYVWVFVVYRTKDQAERANAEIDAVLRSFRRQRDTTQRSPCKN